MSRRTGRDVHGILLLDKPLHMTSNAALQRVKKLLEAKKAGHTGSLDPPATGMLPLCFGEATKFSQFLLEADKYYEVTAKLGEKTTTGGAEGEIVAKAAVPVFSRDDLINVLTHFEGNITQIPSMYSAIKHNGKPLYHYARQGIEVERKVREITIHEMEILGMSDDGISLSVHCSKGTYIRTLIEDIGDKLGCGAYVKTLRRTAVGPYIADKMVSLAEVEEKISAGETDAIDAFLLPLDTSLNGWAEIYLSDLISHYIKQGQPVIIPRSPSEGWVKLLSHSGKFLGVGEVLADGRVAPRRLVAQN